MSHIYTTPVWKASIGDPVAKLVLLMLADSANEKDGGDCWPSVANICKVTHLSERTVQRKMADLETMGLIVRNRGRNRCSYTIKIEAIRQIEMVKNPASVTPRQRDTPSESQFYPVTQSPLPRQSDALPRHSGSCNREPEKNQKLTGTEPELFGESEVVKESKPKRSELVEAIWKAAPKQSRERSSRTQVSDEVAKIKNPPSESELVTAMEFWKACHNWTKENGQFIPGLHLWVKRRQWENLPESSSEADSAPRCFPGEMIPEKKPLPRIE